MRTRTWWGKKRPLHYDIFETVSDDAGGYRINCPHEPGPTTDKPGDYYCLSLDGMPMLEELGLGLVMHVTHPIEHLYYDKRIKVRAGSR